MSRHILVTGAAGGMGRAVCQRLAKAGYCVWGLDLRAGEPIEGMHFVQADLTDEASVQQALQQVAAKTQSLYAIVHTAGIYDLHSLVEMSEQAVQRIFAVNVLSAVRVNRIFLPLLQKGSRILLTTSELAPLDPLPFTGIYAITKAALEKYAYSLRMELQLLGIRVSVIRPGAVETDLLGVSVRALDRFCEETLLYPVNAAAFRRIVNRVEARAVKPDKIAKKMDKALHARRPRYVYRINRNPLLLLLNLLPQRLQVFAIGKVLKK